MTMAVPDDGIPRDRHRLSALMLSFRKKNAQARRIVSHPLSALDRAARIHARFRLNPSKGLNAHPVEKGAAADCVGIRITRRASLTDNVTLNGGEFPAR